MISSSLPAKTIDKQVFMLRPVQEWEDSGLSTKAFCRSHGITTSNFFYWFKKWKGSKEEGAPDSFVAKTPVKEDRYKAQYRIT